MTACPKHTQMHTYASMHPRTLIHTYIHTRRPHMHIYTCAHSHTRAQTTAYTCMQIEMSKRPGPGRYKPMQPSEVFYDGPDSFNSTAVRNTDIQSQDLATPLVAPTNHVRDCVYVPSASVEHPRAISFLPLHSHDP